MRTPPASRVALLIVVAAGVAVATGCRQQDVASSPVAAPVEADLAGTDPTIGARIRELVEAARADPQSAVARGNLGMAYEVNGLPQAAAASYEQARRLDPAEPRYSYYLAQTRGSLGQIEEALEAVDAALALEPDYVPAWLYKGQWLLDLGRTDEAAAAYARAQEIRPDHPAAILGAARVDLRRGEPIRAVQALEGLLPRYGEDPYLNQLLGLAYRDAGQLERARRQLAGGQPLQPGRPPGWPDPWHDEKLGFKTGFAAGMLQAQDRMGRGDVAGAIRIFESLREERPGDVALLNNLSVAYRRAGDPERAFRLLQAGLEQHPDYYPFHLNISAAYERQGRIDLAMQHLDRAIEIYPTLAEAHDRRGRLLLAQKQMAEALESFDTALDYDAARPATLLRAGVLEADFGRWSESARRMEQVIRLQPDAVAAYIVLGRARAELGEFSAAEDALDRAARIQPGNRTLAAVRRRVAELRGGTR